MTQAHPRATLPARPTTTALLVPADVDAAADAARMWVALHERVERQFALYDAADGSPAEQYRAVSAIDAALATHVALEDELLYPAVIDRAGHHDREVERQLEQDHLLDLLMVELGDMLPTTPRYDAKVRVLIQAFRQHARDAETLLVPELTRVLSFAEREELGRRLLERIAQLEGRPRAGW
jgi:Hemerythrin HHE cation binding domain